MAALLPSNFEEAYEIAKTEFFKELKRPQDYDFSKFTSIDDVYEYTEKLQMEQARSGNMRHLNRIRPYLQNLQQYVGVLDVLSQAKGDLLSLIWGPIKLLIQISSTLVKSYDKIIDTMGQIGDRLPHFKKYLDLFKSNDTLKRLLLVFLRDILEFHVTALNFFKSKKWELYFESMWPKYGNRITIIMNNIERHATLISNEVTLASILDAQTAHAEAVKNYERDEEFQRRQDFATVQQSLSPKLYDDDLERYRKQRTPNSGSWIERNEEFCTWLNANASNKVKQVLRIEGIPGAGKSFLSAYIVELAQRQTNSCTLFAFLSFQDQKVTTAKILQSLIFQLALENPDLHQVLCGEVQGNYRSVSSNSTYLQALLIKMLQMSDPTYIIIDGVDEIDESEKSFLLRAMLQVQKQCDEVKLLISSRGEYNIIRLMRNEAVCIYLHSKNFTDIECFVQGRVVDWLRRSEFNEDTAEVIQKLLAPLASKSQGMILYARLVLDNISHRCSLHDINEELAALPRGLDEAYDRILQRITEQLPPKDCNHVKRILSWVYASQIPLQKSELEIAFSIRDGDKGISMERRAFLNVLHLCGPIVEIQRDSIRFAHFTAKQFLADQQITSIIDLRSARLDICRTCITYLGFGCFSHETDDQFEQAILSGELTLFHYATTQWITQLKLYFEGSTDEGERDSLCEEVTDLVQHMESFNQVASSYIGKSSSQDFCPIQGGWPELSTILSMENAFLMFRAPFTSLNSVTLFDSESPLNIFPTYAKFYQALDSMICSGQNHRAGCNCERLKNQYGPGLYKCDRITCLNHRYGFESNRDRDQHLLDHDRPFKCPEAGCTFGQVGFKSGQSLAQHMDQCHPGQKSTPVNRPAIQEIDPEAIEAVLTAAVKANEVAFVSKYLGDIPEDLTDELYLIALRESTSAMVAQFVSSGKSIDKVHVKHPQSYGKWETTPLIVAIEVCNFEVVKYLLANGCKMYGIGSPSKRTNAYTELNARSNALDHALRITNLRQRLESIIILRDNGFNLKKASDLGLWIVKREKSNSDCVLIEILEISKDSLTTKALNQALKAEAETKRSVEIGRWLLQNGAEVNSRGGSLTKKVGTALYAVSVKRTENAAHFAKFLLESGADPTLGISGRLPGEQIGARNISKWLGMTWEELVESTKSARLGRADDAQRNNL